MWCAMLLLDFWAEGLGAPARRRQQFLRWWRVLPRWGGAVPGGRRTGDSVSETERLLQEITTWSVAGGGFIRRLLGG